MHHKFTKHGKSSSGTGCAAAIDYLLGERDHKGDIRPDIQVLRGDPYGVAAVADTLDFSRTYTSGVISWAPEEVPTDTEIEAVLNDWETLAFAGLAPDRYAFTAVLHREDSGGVHVHTITARVDLETGKALNIAPPGHLRDFDAFRDKWNHEQGWARPDDPLRMRVVQPDFEAYRTNSGKPKIKAEITENLLDAAAQGLIRDANDVRQYLTESLNCEITRSGKDYLSIKPQGATRAIRLKGEMYGDGWTAQATLEREVKADASQRVGRGGEIDKARADEARRAFEAACQRRAEYNRKRYLRAKTGHQLAVTAAAPGLEYAQPDAGKDEILNRERSARDQAGLNRGIAAGAERDPRTSAEPLKSELEAIAEGRGSPALDNDKSVAETLTDLTGGHGGGRAGGVWNNSNDGADLLPKDKPDQPAQSGNKTSPTDVGRITERDHVRLSERKEVHPFPEDRENFQAGRGAVQGENGSGDRVNDGSRTIIEGTAPTEPAKYDTDAERAQGRGGRLTRAVKRLAARMGEFGEKLLGAVQDARKRLGTVQTADRERISALYPSGGRERNADDKDLTAVGEQLNRLDDTTEQLNAAAKRLESASPALVERLARKKDRDRGPRMRM